MAFWTPAPDGLQPYGGPATELLDRRALIQASARLRDMSAALDGSYYSLGQEDFVPRPERSRPPPAWGAGAGSHSRGAGSHSRLPSWGAGPHSRPPSRGADKSRLERAPASPRLAERIDPEEVRMVIDELLRYFPVLQDTRHPRAAAELAKDGRVVIAQELGLPPTVVALWREAASEGRPATASPRRARRRYAEVDIGVLAEACGMLRLGLAPWPPTRTVAAAATRLLAVVGALGSIVDAPGLDRDLGEVAAWALDSIANLLRGIADGQQITKTWSSYSGANTVRRRAASSRARTPSPTRASFLGEDEELMSSRVGNLNRSLSRSRSGASCAAKLLRPGDEVLAHWALPSGECSQGIEDAEVLGVDDRGRVRLRYVDGMVLHAPRAWVVSRKDAPLPAAGDADRVLSRLIRTAASSGEIARRVRDLCVQPRGVGHSSLSAAIRESLAVANLDGQRSCAGALCALCSCGGADAEAARTMANAMILSGCRHLPINRRQQMLLQRAEVLSDLQRDKLVRMSDAGHWVPVF